MKRPASPVLISRPSPYHAGVTLLLDAASSITLEAEPALRRSKRVKVEEISVVKLEEEEVIPETRSGKKPRAKVVSKSSTSAVKIEEVEALDVRPTKSKAKREPSSTSSPRKQKAIPQSLDNPHPAPLHWRDTYDTIKRMRANITAPVDTMGCDQAQNKETEPQVSISFSLVSNDIEGTNRIDGLRRLFR